MKMYVDKYIFSKGHAKILNLQKFVPRAEQNRINNIHYMDIKHRVFIRSALITVV